MARPGLFVLIGVCCAASLAYAVAGERAEPWTADDILMAERASGWTFSPDGAMVAWVKSTIDRIAGQDRSVSDLLLTRLTDGSTQALTHGETILRSPAFSPDGRRLAFLSNRKPPGDNRGGATGTVQIWAVSVASGEPFQVTRFERGVRNFAWQSAEGFVVAAQESPAYPKEPPGEQADDTYVAGEATPGPPIRLFTVSLEGGRVARLTENDDRIRSLSVDHQGRTAVVSAEQGLSREYDPTIPPTTYLVDLESGGMKRIFADGVLRPSSVRWSPDGKGFYFFNICFRDPRYRPFAGVVELHYHDLAKGTAEKVDVGWPRGMGRGFCPTTDGVVGSLVDGVYFRPVKLRRGPEGWHRLDLTGPHVPAFTEFEADPSGKTIVYQYSKPNLPPQWYAAKLDGSRMVGEHNLTEINPRSQGKPLGKIETLIWKGARDEQVEGILYYPLDHQAGKRYPLVLDIHGGPSSSNLYEWQHDWASPVILWQQKGAFVLQVNYHGSLGYGPDWVESLGGHFLELEIVDLENGVDELIRRGLVDPDRLAVSGWSNGGTLSAALLVHTNRFKAAAVGAAPIEWISQGSTVLGTAFSNYYFGGLPWEGTKAYLERSPLFGLGKVATPTIVSTGTEDPNVAQSRVLYHALRQIGKVPVRLVLFPGEPHQLNDLVHQRRKIQEDMAWFDRYLFDRPPSDE